MKLYTYWRSSSSWRVRIALNYKEIEHTLVPVDLLGAEHESPAHQARNAMGQIPVLETEHGPISQSLAIIEYLDEVCPEPALLPKDPYQRARARALAEVVNSGVQPIQNMSVLIHVVNVLGSDKGEWGRHWIERGMARLEQMVEPGPYCLGEQLTIADLCLVPQLYNARRFGCAVDEWPKLLAIEAACAALPAFQDAHPDTQPDAPAR